MAIYVCGESNSPVNGGGNAELMLVALTLLVPGLKRILCPVKLHLPESLWEEIRQVDVSTGRDCIDKVGWYGWTTRAGKEQTLVVCRC